VIALVATAHLYLFAWSGEPPKALFMLPSEGENACGVGPFNFGPPDGSWSSGSGGAQVSCEFRQVVQPDALLPAWIDAGKMAPGADIEVSWVLAGGGAKGTGHKATLKPEPVSLDALRSTAAGLSATAAKAKNNVRVELRNGGQGPILVGDAIAARNRPDDSCVGAGPQLLLQPGETLVDIRPGLLSKSMKVYAAAFTGPKKCRWVEVQRR
jgi:hypothetical protein